MGFIYRESYYRGLPADQVAAMEAIAQATVTRLFELTGTLNNLLQSGQSFGGHYSLQKKPAGLLLCQDRSAGWWAILQTIPDPVVEFRLFAREGDMPLWVQEGEGFATWPFRGWQRLAATGEVEHGDLYLLALRGDRGWYCPHHRLDYQHPLLTNLEGAVEALRAA